VCERIESDVMGCGGQIFSGVACGSVLERKWERYSSRIDEPVVDADRYTPTQRL
jgi:DNA-directed RNA polymerase subunit N (RpoN/RPB10)